MDGQEASIEVVEDQPYKEVTLESGTTNVTGVTYLFKKVGVQLTVTPRINDERIHQRGHPAGSQPDHRSGTTACRRKARR